MVANKRHNDEKLILLESLLGEYTVKNAGRPE
jgi:hypothetical protein